MVKIKVMPGHKTKINQLVDYIKTVLFFSLKYLTFFQIIPDIMYEPVRKKKKNPTPSRYLKKNNSKPKTAVRP